MAISIHDVMGVWCFLIGASIGSFLNVVIYRIPRGYHLHLPSRSACPKCARKLKWFENIPVFSFLFQRGRCLGCQTLISPRYPVVEILTAFLFLAIYTRFLVSAETVFYCVFAAALLAITFIDLEFRIIPDVISIPVLVFGVLFSHFIEGFGVTSSVAGLFLGGGAFWFLAWGYEKITGREGLGFGDVKLLAMIGAFLGPKGVVLTILLSSVLGSAIGILMMVREKKNLRYAVPFGPFLAVAALVFLFWGERIEVWIAPIGVGM